MIERITSPHNAKLTRVRRLKEREGRREQGLFILEGVNLIKDIPDFACVNEIYIDEKKADELSELAGKFTDKIYSVNSAVINKLSDTVTPSGIVCVAAIPKEKLGDGNAVICDRLQDPSNLGAVIRTAAACGLTDIYLMGGADAYNPKAVRASMGAIWHVNVHGICGADLTRIKQLYTVYALDMRGENIFGKRVIKGRWAVIVGNESQGISELSRSTADGILSLPMCGKIQSLNAGVAAGIAIYQLTYNQ